MNTEMKTTFQEVMMIRINYFIITSFLLLLQHLGI